MASALEYFESGARENVREDGRENCMFRTVVVERGVVESAAGSAQVQVGDTKVLCGLSLEMCNPVENKPKGGLVEVSVDVSMARSIAGSSWKEYDKDGEELANQIKRLYVNGDDSSSEPGTLDRDNDLSIAEGQSVWLLHMDCVVVNDDGSLLDALSMACRASLLDLRIPKFEVLETSEVGPSGPDITIDEDPNSFWTLDCSAVPVIVSIGIVERNWLFDMSKREETLCRNVLSFGVASGGVIKQVKSMGSANVSYKVMNNVIEAASLAGNKLVSSLDAGHQGDMDPVRIFHLGK